MGVTDLWTVLESTGEPCHLSKLRGHKVAVDASIWLAQGEGAYSPHGNSTSGLSSFIRLKTIFWRVYRLIRHEVYPIFVFEGKAPHLKNDVLTKRLEGKGQSASVLSSPIKHFGRKEFECSQLLDLLGVPWVKAVGEAEATCAWLNKEKIVDACITEDGDAFLFGANTICKGFTVDENKTEMKIFNIDQIEKKLGLNRDRLIAYALLVGCDYYKGVADIGKESATKLLQKHRETNMFDLFKAWKDEATFYEDIENLKGLPKPSHCGQCGHTGTVVTHDKQGCQYCHIPKGCLKDLQECDCAYHINTRKYMDFKTELKIRRQALLDPDFPKPKVIKEFQNPTVDTSKKDYMWRRPNFYELRTFCIHQLKMKESGLENKLISLMTAYDMAHMGEKAKMCYKPLVPKSILKSRISNGIPVLEVQWDSIDGIDSKDAVTTERKDYFRDHFPDMVKEFEVRTATSKGTPKRKKNVLPETPEKNRKIDQMFKARKKLPFTDSPAGSHCSRKDKFNAPDFEGSKDKNSHTTNITEKSHSFGVISDLKEREPEHKPSTIMERQNAFLPNEEIIVLSDVESESDSSQCTMLRQKQPSSSLGTSSMSRTVKYSQRKSGKFSNKMKKKESGNVLPMKSISSYFSKSKGK